MFQKWLVYAVIHGLHSIHGTFEVHIYYTVLLSLCNDKADSIFIIFQLENRCVWCVVVCKMAWEWEKQRLKFHCSGV